MRSNCSALEQREYCPGELEPISTVTARNVHVGAMANKLTSYDQTWQSRIAADRIENFSAMEPDEHNRLRFRNLPNPLMVVARPVPRRFAGLADWLLDFACC